MANLPVSRTRGIKTTNTRSRRVFITKVFAAMPSLVRKGNLRNFCPEAENLSPSKKVFAWYGRQKDLRVETLQNFAAFVTNSFIQTFPP